MNSMADNQKVYQAIKTIADELCKENKTYLRADLAFELKKVWYSFRFLGSE